MIYILYFIFLSMIMYLMDLKNKNYRLLKTFIITMLIILPIGLRSPNMGNDTEAYINIFYDCNKYENFFEPFLRYEMGYIILNRLIGLIYLNHNFAFCVIAFLTVFPLVYISLKKSEMPIFSINLILLLGFFGSYMNILRQSLAVTIIFISYFYFKDKKYFKYALLVLLATSMHKTGLFGLLIIPISLIKFNSFNESIAIYFTLFIVLSFNYILKLLAIIFPQYAHYFSGSYFDGTGRLAMAFNVIFLLVIIVLIEIYRRKYFKDNEQASKSTFFDWMPYILLCLFLIGFRANIVDRITSYFSILLIIYLPNFAYRLNDKDKRIFMMVTCVSLAIKIVTIMYLRPEWNHILPYEFFF